MSKKLLFFVLSFFLFLGIDKALTKAPVDITTMGIEDITQALEKGYLTSEMLVKMYLERIEVYDSQFNAISSINDNALAEAKQLDEMRSVGKLKGKLHGIPILVKSNIDVVGLATNAGTKALADNFPLENSFVVQKLVDEGAIILGSCNMSALAFSAHNSYGYTGYVRNAFDVSKTSYGSSGGSAVAVAAGFAVAALGTDTNSSVRAPASGAGLVGIRPTYGLVSHTGVIPYDFERDTVGVLSHNVADNALILGIISGYDDRDATTEGTVVKDYSVKKASLSGVRIGVLTQYVKGRESESGVTGLTDVEIVNMVEKSIKELEDAGAEIVYLDKFVKSSNLMIASSTQAGSTMCDYFNEYIKGTTGKIRSFKELANSSGTVWDLSGYANSCGNKSGNRKQRDEKKNNYRDYVTGYFSDYDLDVMLYPTVKNLASAYNETGNVIPGSSLGSVIGFPSITVPMDKASDGLFYGIEFLAQAYEEDMLYNVAQAYEEVNGNKINGTALAPSLYEVPESVRSLIEIYEDALMRDNGVEMGEWIDSVQAFFRDYNNIDEEERALELVSMYMTVSEDGLKSLVLDNRNGYVYYFVLGLVVLCMLIIVKEVCIL